MNTWEEFKENMLPPKAVFYNNLNLEGISDEDYLHAQKVWNVFEINNIGDYHDLYVQSDTILLADMKTLKICVLKNINLIPHILCLRLD